LHLTTSFHKIFRTFGAKKVTLALVLVSVLICESAMASADSPPALEAPAGLSFAEIKMAGDEFIVLQNTRRIPSMT
jgi:hypothetical protein